MSAVGSSKSKHSGEMKPKTSLFSTVYLFFYNFLQVLGWTHILVQVGLHYVQGNSTDTLWESVELFVIVFQNAAILEVFNVAAGLVKSNLVITTFQVASRIMVVCGVLLPTPTAPKSYGLPLLLLAWSVTEIIRYSYYALNILNVVPAVLVWCRYTFFIALYPIGVTGELLCFYAAQNYAKESLLWSYTLPNALNFAFSYQYLLIGIMISYVPCCLFIANRSAHTAITDVCTRPGHGLTEMTPITLVQGVLDALVLNITSLKS